MLELRSEGDTVSSRTPQGGAGTPTRFPLPPLLPHQSTIGLQATAAEDLTRWTNKGTAARRRHQKATQAMPGLDSLAKPRNRQPPTHAGTCRKRRGEFAGTQTSMLPGVPEAQCAFKVLMIRKISQFALRIAFRCVLHRCGSQDIRC